MARQDKARQGVGAKQSCVMLLTVQVCAHMCAMQAMMSFYMSPGGLDVNCLPAAAAAVVAEVAADMTDTPAAAGTACHKRLVEAAAGLEQHSMLPIVWLALAAATVDTAHIRATAANMCSGPALTCLHTVLVISACLAAELRLHLQQAGPAAWGLAVYLEVAGSVSQPGWP